MCLVIIAKNFFTGFYRNMNIINLRATTPIFRQEPELPPKIEFTKIEQEYIPVLKELYTLNSNIYTQKQNLRNYYSSADRCDYRELLKQRRNLIKKLERIAQKLTKTIIQWNGK